MQPEQPAAELPAALARPLGSTAHPEQQQGGRRLLLRAVEIEGFKSYAGRVVLGDPFGDFTCIVGPNGCGKSVVGEAIAFALGGNARMMRAKNLGSLVSHTPGLALLPAAAQVTLQFDIRHLPENSPEDDAAGSFDSEACRNPEAAAAGPAPLSRLFIRRRVTRSGRSDYAVRQLPAMAEDGKAANSQPVRQEWQPTTPQGLRELLAPLGIQTEAVDRFIVTQHRQAVQVQEPSQLANFLETLIGTAAYEEELRRLEAQAAEVAGQYDAAEETMAELELQRRQLAPDKARWQQYQEQVAAHGQQKARVLSQQVSLLERQLSAMRQQATELESSIASHAAEQAEAQRAADGLLARKLAAAKKVKAAESQAARLAKEGAGAQLQVAKLRVQLKVAMDGAGSGAKQKQLDKKLDKARKEAEKNREALAAAKAKLQQLQSQEAAVVARVQQLQREMESVGEVASLADVLAAQQQVQEAVARQAAATEEEQKIADMIATGEAEIECVEAAAEQQQARHLEAKLKANELLLERGELQAACRRAQEQLREARRLQYQRQAEVQVAQDAAREQLAQLAETQHSSRASTAASRQTLDQAVCSLAEASAADRLPGAFYGRLHSVARVAEHESAAVATAVNAALLEVANPASCLVVADRATAQHAVSHFERHRVGVAVCKILSELQQVQDQRSQRGADSSGRSVSGLRPLLACVEAHPSVPGSQQLLDHMLSSWWLAADRQAAIQAVREDRAVAASGRKRRNIATLQGDVFKADGEVVGARAPPAHLRSFLLTTSFAPAGGLPASAGARDAKGAGSTAGEREQLEQQAQALQAQVAQLQRQAEHARADAERVAAEAGGLQQQLRENEAELDATQKSLRQMQAAQQRLARQSQHTEQLRLQVLAWRELQAAASASLSTAKAAVARAELHLQQATAAYEEGMAGSSAGQQLLVADGELLDIRGQAASLQQRVEAAQAALTAASRQQAQLQAAKKAAETGAAQVGQLEQQLRGLEERSNQQRQEARRLADESVVLQQHCSSMDAEWRAAVKRHESTTRCLQKQQVELRELKAAQLKRGEKLQSVHAALEAALEETGNSSKSAVTAGEGSEGSKVADGNRSSMWRGPGPGENNQSSSESEGEDGPLNQRRRLSRQKQRSRSANQPSRSTRSAASEGRATGAAARGAAAASNRGSSSCEEPDSDFEPAPVGRRRRRLRSRRSSQPACGGQPRGVGGRRALESVTAGREWSEQAVEAALEDLEEDEKRLQALHSSLNQAALAQDAAAAAQLHEAGRRLDELAESLQALEGKQGRLQAERYQRFHAALTAVNAKLSGIYAQLTGGQGDAYCSYSEDVLAAFTDGVTFHVRPDRQRWRPFPSLSGGQQALATLALCFALQAAFPSPFYFFDEIDCALDTVNASRVADYIAGLQQAGTGVQFLVVSHRPQVYERAACLLGVYSCQHGSHAVTVHMA